MIYEPREDSFLLEKHVSKHAKNKFVLDMGTGSGIQAKAAAKVTSKVVACDINPSVVKNFKVKNVEIIKSDLFSNLKKYRVKPGIESGFDLILFNAPYLPNDPGLKDVALDGGPEGYEVSVRFLEESYDYLKNGGRILLLFSSLSKPSKIVDAAKKLKYRVSLIDSMKLDFEELYVYSFEKPWKQGKRGLIYLNSKTVIKTNNPKSRSTMSLEKEAMFLKKLNKSGIGPKLISFKDMEVKMEYVEGELIGDFLDKKQKNCKKVIIEVLKQCNKMDKLGINKYEMTNPYKHVIIGKKIVLIDFERCIYTEKPKNVTQFLQYLISRTVAPKLKKNGIDLDKEEIIKLANEYKKNSKEFTKIIKYIQ